MRQLKASPLNIREKKDLMLFIAKVYFVFVLLTALIVRWGLFLHKVN